METNIRSPSFHSWQSCDEVDKHLHFSVLSGYLVYFVNRRIPEKRDEKAPV